MSYNGGPHPSPVAARRRRRGRSFTPWLAGALSATLVVSLLHAPPAAAAAGRAGGTASPAKSVRVGAVKTRSAGAAPSEKNVWSPSSVTWPQAATVAVDLPAGRSAAQVGPRVRAGSTPVSIGRGTLVSATTAASQPTRATVEVLPASAAQAAGLNGLLLRVKRTDGAAAPGPVALDIDVSTFAGAFGGDWASRLNLVRYPSCVLTAPTAEACAAATPVASSVFNNNTMRLSAQVEVQADALVPADPRLRKVAAMEAGSTSGADVLAVVATGGATSDTGDFTKTPFSASYQWQSGASGGDFTWSYGVDTPPVPGDLDPEVELSYSSGAVDGQTAGANVQPGMIGEGWSYAAGYVERNYRTCADDTANTPYYTNATGDQCWRLPNAHMVLNGKNTELILGSDGKWRAANDDAAKVELLTGAGNGDNDGEHWRVTTTDGTQYYFGVSRLPNWSTGKRETNSAWTVPVFANHSGEPCFVTTGFANSKCVQAWRWNLDYVVDRNGNSMAYFYTKEQQRTGLAGNAASVLTYDRGGWLDHIEYGMRAGSELANATPPAKVVFGTAERCLASCWSGAAWTSTATAANWPDTPWDLYCATTATSCANNVAPSFWTARRLSSVTTQVWSGSGTTYNNVDQWDFTHQFPSTGNGTSPVLWLASIVHTGKANGGSVALPSVTFGGTRFDNRADYDPNGTMAQPRKYRITTVDTETGGQLAIAYSGQDTGCQFGSAFPDPDNNTKRCFSQYYKPQQAPAGFSWWHKYIVNSVTEKDLVGGSPDFVHAYAYSTANASTSVLWAHDEGPTTWTSPLAKRSWADWRGYPTVTVTEGPAGNQSQTQMLYFRGLKGDYTDAGENARASTMTNSLGEVWQDDKSRAGFLHEKIEFSGAGGQALRKTIVDPVAFQTGQRTLTTNWAIPSVQTAYINRTAKERNLTWLAASNSWRTTAKVYTWDTTYGLVTKVDDQGDTATTADDQCERTWYTYNTTKYLIDFPNREETVGVNCATTATYPADAVDDERSFYDGATSYSTAPNFGNVTKVETVASFTGTTPNPVKVKTNAYDLWGRETSEGDALDRFTTTEFTQNTAGLTVTEKETTPAGHSTTSTLDPAWGEPVKQVDPNGKTTEATYDALGRLLKVWQPGRDKATQTPNDEYIYTVRKSGGVSAIQSKELGPNGNQISSFELYDGLLRQRQTQTTAPDGKRVIADTTFDGRGLAVKQSSFYNSASGPTDVLASFADTDVANQHRFTYDGLDRQASDELWSANVKKWTVSTTTYGGDRTTVDNAAGDTDTTTILDARGRTTERRLYLSFADYSDLVAGDFTNDGKTDLFAVRSDGGQRVVFYGKGDGTFTPSTGYPSAGWDSYRNWVSGRFDSDSNLDAIGIRKSDGALIRYQGDGGGSITNPAQVGGGFSIHSELAAGDFDGDGYTDLVAIRASDGMAQYLHAQSGGGAFDNPVDLTTDWSGYEHLVASDADGDGKADLLAIRTSDKMLHRWLGNGNGTFATGTDLFTGWKRANLAAGDFTGDGKADLFGAYPVDQADPTLKRWSGNGTTFTSMGSLGIEEGSAYDASTYTFDSDGSLTKVTDPAGNHWDYTYDLLGRQLSATDPDKGTSTSTYDNAGQVLTSTDARGKTVAYTYDSLGRKNGQYDTSTSGTKLAEWTYDTLAKGQLTSSTRYVGADAYVSSVTSYDNEYRALGTSITLPASEGSLAGTYASSTTYNVDGSVATVAYPAAGGLAAETVTSTYTDTGFKVSEAGLDTYLASVTYDYDGAVLQKLLGSGGSRVQLTSPIDAATRQPTKSEVYTEHPGAPSTWDEQLTESYSYDQAGNITAIAETQAGAIVADQCFSFDGLRRLTQAWTTTAATCQTTPTQATVAGTDAYWHSYAYDRVGRRTGQTLHSGDGDTTHTYHYGGTQPHALVTVDKAGPGGTSTDTYSYDETGNTTARPGQTLTWDVEGELAKVTAGGQDTTFLYDADGNRMIRRDPGGTVTAYMGSTELRKDAAGTVTATRYYGKTAIRTTAGLTWLAGDHHGTGEVAIDAGTLAPARRRLDPFGMDRGAPVAWPGERGFVGGVQDPTGLTHLGAREYDPTLGRFTSVDPVFDTDDPQSMTGYAYCSSDPVNCVDADGHWGWKKLFNAVATVASVVSAVVPGPIGAAIGVASAGLYLAAGNKSGAAWALAGAAATMIGLGAVALAAKGARLAAGAARLAGGVAKASRYVAKGAARGANALSRGAKVAGRGARDLAGRGGKAIKAVKNAASRWKQSAKINAQKQAGHIKGTPQYINRTKVPGKLTSSWRGGQRWANFHTRLAWTFGRVDKTGGRVMKFPWQVGDLGGRVQRSVRATFGKGSVHGSPWF